MSVAAFRRSSRYVHFAGLRKIPLFQGRGRPLCARCLEFSAQEGRSDGDQFAMKMNSIAREALFLILTGHFLPKRDGLTDIREGFLACSPLAPAPRQRRTAYRETFLVFDQLDGKLHVPRIAHHVPDRKLKWVPAEAQRSWQFSGFSFQGRRRAEEREEGLRILDGGWRKKKRKAKIGKWKWGRRRKSRRWKAKSGKRNTCQRAQRSWQFSGKEEGPGWAALSSFRF